MQNDTERLYGVFYKHALAKVFDDLDSAKAYVRVYIWDRPTDERAEVAKHYNIRRIAEKSELVMTFTA